MAAMTDRRIVILSPLRAEADAVARALRPGSGGPRRPSADRDANPMLGTIGVGAAGLDLARIPRDAAIVIVAGVAGALDPDWRPGDVLIDGAPAGFAPSDRWRAGRIHTSHSIVHTPDQKRRLHRETGCQVVEMEHAIVREALAGRGLPVCGVRAVLDGADESLPRAVASLTDARGRTRPARVACALCRREVAPRSLLWLARRSRLATSRLGEVVAALATWIGHPQGEPRPLAETSPEPASCPST
jgi:hypothetical protein